MGLNLLCGWRIDIFFSQPTTELCKHSEEDAKELRLEQYFLPASYSLQLIVIGIQLRNKFNQYTLLIKHSNWQHKYIFTKLGELI